MRMFYSTKDNLTFSVQRHFGFMRSWHLATGEVLVNIAGHTKSVWSVVFSLDGQTLASSSGDETIKLWSIPGDIIS